jgi:hypothetical protein
MLNKIVLINTFFATVTIYSFLLHNLLQHQLLAVHLISHMHFNKNGFHPMFLHNLIPMSSVCVWADEVFTGLLVHVCNLSAMYLAMVHVHAQ